MKRTPQAARRGYFINRSLQARKNKLPTGPAAKQQKLSEDISDESAPDVTSDKDAEKSSESNAMDIDALNSNSPNVSVPDAVATGSADQLRSAGSSTGGSGQTVGSGMRGMAPLPTSNPQPSGVYTRTFRKQYHFRIKNEAVYTKSGNTDAVSNGYIRYPFHDLPVDYLAFYLSKAEIHQLSNYTEVRVKHCKVDVFNKTGCLNFETAASVSSIGNNNVGIYLCQLDPDIVKYREGTYFERDIAHILHGNPYPKPSATGWTTDNAYLGAQYVRRNLYRPFEYKISYVPERSRTQTPATAPYPATFSLPLFNPLTFITKKINASFDEGHFTSWEYKPKSGLIMGQYTNNYVNRARTAMMRRKLPLITNFDQPPTNAFGSSAKVQGYAFNKESLYLRNFRNLQVANYDRLKIDEYTVGGPTRIPTLCIGIEPLTTELNGKWEAVNAFVDLTVNTYCTIEIKQGVPYINGNTRSVIVPDYMQPEYNLCVQDDTTENILTSTDNYFDNSDMVDFTAVQPSPPNHVLTQMPVFVPTNSSTTRTDKEEPTDKTTSEPTYKEVYNLRSHVSRHQEELEQLKHKKPRV